MGAMGTLCDQAEDPSATQYAVNSPVAPPYDRCVVGREYRPHTPATRATRETPISINGSERISFDVTLTDASGNMVTAFATIAFGINPDGFIVGQYAMVAGGPLRGFIAAPLSGK
jgi:hypothetical protein